MEKLLIRLFDYQAFESCSELQRIIDSVHARYAAKVLSFDEMEWVNAAGDPNQSANKTNKDHRP